MIRESLVGKIFGIQFIHDKDVQDEDAMLIIDAHLIGRWREQRFGGAVDPPIMTKAAIATMRGRDYLKNVEKVAGSKISMRLVEIPQSKRRAQTSKGGGGERETDPDQDAR